MFWYQVILISHTLTEHLISRISHIIIQSSIWQWYSLYKQADKGQELQLMLTSNLEIGEKKNLWCDLSDFIVKWLLVPDGLVWVPLKLLISRDFLPKQSPEFLHRMMQKPKNIQFWAAALWIGNASLMREVINGQTGLSRHTQFPVIQTRTLNSLQWWAKCISEFTTHRTSRWMSYSGRASCHVTLLSKNKNLRLQWEQS